MAKYLTISPSEWMHTKRIEALKAASVSQLEYGDPEMIRVLDALERVRQERLQDQKEQWRKDFNEKFPPLDLNNLPKRNPSESLRL